MGPISGALSGTILLWVTHEAANIQGEVSNILSHWILKIENVQLLRGVYKYLQNVYLEDEDFCGSER